MLSKKIKSLPDSPGVYFFYNQKKEIIYVGKATSLKSRVKSYFILSSRGVRDSGRRGDPLVRSAHKDSSQDEGIATVALLLRNDSRRPIEEMLHEVTDIKWEKTNSVLEAIILEGIKIKKLKPKYNIKWRDDKSWNYLLITKEKFPRLISAREHDLKKINTATLKHLNIKKLRHTNVNNYRYIFGPFPGINISATIKILRRIFKFSDCRPNSGKPCFYRQISQCLGVCTGEITPQEYNKKVISPLKDFLSGKRVGLVKKLNTKMKEASAKKDFEEAGRLRDQIVSLRKIQDVVLVNESFIRTVIPAKAGIHGGHLDSRFRGNDNMRIEGYDISNLGTADKVGSMVVFDESGPIKSEYKKFNIKTVLGQSDVDCLQEVLRRRLNHGEWPLPDIFLIDGGLPQVNSVRKILKEKNITRPLVGIVKGPRRKRNDFVLADSVEKDLLGWVKENKNLLIRVRDEAHRFAIKFNRSKRKIK